MITIDQIEKKLGKQKATEFVKNNIGSGKTKAQKDRGIRGRLKDQYCGTCRSWFRKNYEWVGHKEPCVETGAEIRIKKFKPYFNIGLGCFVESRSEEKSTAKKLGLVEAG